MFFTALGKAAKTIIINPLILLPAIIVGILSLAVGNFVEYILSRPITDFLLYSDTFTNENIIYTILTNYPVEIVELLVAGFVMLTISFIAMYAISKRASGKGVGESINDAVMNWKRCVTESVFFYLLIIVVFAVLFAISWVFSTIGFAAGGAVNDFLNIILVPVIFIIILALVAVKVAFILPAITESKLKTALQKSSAFSNGRFIPAILFIIVAAIIYWLISSAFYYAALWFVDFDFVFFIIGDAIALTYLVLAISYYYFLE